VSAMRKKMSEDKPCSCSKVSILFKFLILKINLKNTKKNPFLNDYMRYDYLRQT
jgi:hypothetical protein